MANKTAQEAGLKGLQKETVNRNMLNPTLDAQGMENIIKQDLAKGVKIKNGQFTEGRYIQVLRGINNIRKVSGIKAVEGFLDEVDFGSVAYDVLTIANGISYYSRVNINAIKGLQSADIPKVLGHNGIYEEGIQRDNLVAMY